MWCLHHGGISLLDPILKVEITIRLIPIFFLHFGLQILILIFIYKELEKLEFNQHVHMYSDSKNTWNSVINYEDKLFKIFKTSTRNLGLRPLSTSCLKVNSNRKMQLVPHE